MGWIKLIHIPVLADHVCTLPPPTEDINGMVGIGSIWECDDCASRYYISLNKAGQRVWVKYPINAVFRVGKPEALDES